MSIDDESVTTLDDLKGDLARRYNWTPSSGASVDPAIVDADMQALDRDGYVIWENMFSAEECQQIRDAGSLARGHRAQLLRRAAHPAHLQRAEQDARVRPACRSSAGAGGAR